MKTSYYKSFNPITFTLIALSVQFDFFVRTIFMGRRKKVRFMSRLMLQHARPHRR